MSGRLRDYACEVLSFGFAGAGEGAVPPPPQPEAAGRMARRCAEAFGRSGRKGLALLGLGSGAVAGLLAEALPPGALVVCEQDLPLARALLRAGALAWAGLANGAGGERGPDAAGARLALDASPFAILLLLDREGLGPQDLLVLPNPELGPADKARLRPLELLLGRSARLELPHPPQAPRLSCAAILSPTEPDLPEFFAQFPDWISELVLVWDADAAPDMALPGAFPVRQLCRRLGGDFSAQRDAMLEACAGDFVLYLDADERLSPAAFAALPALCAAPGVAGWHFPRLSPYPDASRVLTGFGLWPDIQLRLFRRTPCLRFVNPVHERLTGLAGAQALALDVEIEHVSRLRKGEAETRAKLAGFDAAGGGSVRHALSGEYPSVPRALVAAPQAPRPRGLLLPAAD